jgi:hypothetical protein
LRLYHLPMIPPIFILSEPDTVFDAYWTWLVAHEQPLGQGTGRITYRIPGTDLVVKKARTPQHVGANWVEIVVARHVHHDGHLGEVRAWSYSGTYLVMEYLADIDEDIDGDAVQTSLSDMPSWLSDRSKKENFGRVPGTSTIKARDYSTIGDDPKIGSPSKRSGYA